MYPLDDVRGPRRPNRGVTQRLKGGVAAGMVVMDVLIAATQNSGNYTIMEIVVESGALSAPFGPPERCAWTLDGLRSWLSSCASLAARALPSPGHKAARPGGAGSSPLDGSPHWCCQPVGGTTQAIAAVEMGGGSVASANFGATAVQPAVSQGLQLDFLKERDEVNRVCLSLCAFGWPENPAQVASKREVVIEANNQAMACGPGISEGGGPANYKSWPTALCDRLLESAAPGGCVSLR